MSTLLISLLTLVLLLISAFVILIVLMQKTSQSGGMGAALGGSAAESAFGSDTNNILTKGTVYGIILFFLVALGLYLLYQSQSTSAALEVDMNSLITSQEEPSVAETKIESVESSDLGETSGDLVESIEAGAAEPVDAASNDTHPASN
ncbi:MAG: preprotein translocase subunit SecG [Puniceicoccaceae bacterium]|nr:preprotein translocase subunit SecG [Puniceicoccaceae bacterium]